MDTSCLSFKSIFVAINVLTTFSPVFSSIILTQFSRPYKDSLLVRSKRIKAAVAPCMYGGNKVRNFSSPAKSQMLRVIGINLESYFNSIFFFLKSTPIVPLRSSEKILSQNRNKSELLPTSLSPAKTILNLYVE